MELQVRPSEFHQLLRKVAIEFLGCAGNCQWGGEGVVSTDEESCCYFKLGSKSYVLRSLVFWQLTSRTWRISNR